MKQRGNGLWRLLRWLWALIVRPSEHFEPEVTAPRYRIYSWLSFRRGMFRRRKYRLERER